eukprot:Blabericola_migrator_1__5676@NODE_2883_length_2246_cov_41_376778_g1808_i0_p2_GENE_NODE_2883_length_2246_cov_41_376778_g1808_i0NODE_2883_length_2246_cov_41_376778_g1808_i0_p2_ORF_typecomplete_len192_score25_42Apolipoprotein/PF01442_18/0_0002YtxH/PF12732_7/0_061ApoLpIII/PF07464_11/0_053PspB/PF06667_12/1_2PspB/PF06667_12/2_5e02Synuclein/PF01387_17/0_098DUF3322/PF11795_8/0_14DUF883/PF05957_13/0_19DUF948/PF06103_11/0_12DUF948/PF06103_11/9_1e03Fz/PF01392_22/0_24_NODE_2883_length_2246_cov_41_376778_g18
MFRDQVPAYLHLKTKILMLSVEAKPSRKLACHELVTVLLCPIIFPTPSTLLNATQGQVTQSANELAEQVTQNASELAERVTQSANELVEQVGQVSRASPKFFNTDDGSGAGFLTEPTEHLTTRQASDGSLTTAGWYEEYGEVIAALVILWVWCYLLYRRLSVLRGNRAFEPNMGAHRDMIPLRDNAPSSNP